MITLYQNTTPRLNNILRLLACSTTKARHTVSAYLPTLWYLTHLGVKVVLDHMGRLARLFIENLAHIFCSDRRSIHFTYQLYTTRVQTIQDYDLRCNETAYSLGSGFKIL